MTIEIQQDETHGGDDVNATSQKISMTTADTLERNDYYLVYISDIINRELKPNKTHENLFKDTTPKVDTNMITDDIDLPLDLEVSSEIPLDALEPSQIDCNLDPQSLLQTYIHDDVNASYIEEGKGLENKHDSDMDQTISDGLVKIGGSMLSRDGEETPMDIESGGTIKANNSNNIIMSKESTREDKSNYSRTITTEDGDDIDVDWLEDIKNHTVDDLVLDDDVNKTEDEEFQQKIKSIENVLSNVSKTKNADEEELKKNLFTMAVKEELQAKIYLNQVSAEIAESTPAKSVEETQVHNQIKSVEERKARNRMHAKVSRERQKTNLSALKQNIEKLAKYNSRLKKEIIKLEPIVKRLESLRNEWKCTCYKHGDINDTPSSNATINCEVRNESVERNDDTDSRIRKEATGSTDIIPKEFIQQDVHTDKIRLDVGDDVTAIHPITTSKDNGCSQVFKSDIAQNDSSYNENFRHYSRETAMEHVKTEREGQVNRIKTHQEPSSLKKVNERSRNRMDTNSAPNARNISVERRNNYNTVSNLLLTFNFIDEYNSSDYPCTNVWDVGCNNQALIAPIK